MRIRSAAARGDAALDDSSKCGKKREENQEENEGIQKTQRGNDVLRYLKP